MSYILQTNHLTKNIDGKELVKNVNIHVKKGEIYGFLGPNGAGKTTVLKMVTNLWKPTQGSVELFGRPLTPKSYEVFRRMGSIIEFPVFYDHLSGKENLGLHCEYMGYYHAGSVEKALEMLELTEAADKPVKTYSLGMKQRLGIARAILCGPELLVLDEPTNGLDPAGMKHLRDLLKMLCAEYGITMILSSHILSEVSAVCNYVMIIAHGRLIASDTIENLSTYLVGSNVLHMTVRGDLGRIRMAINTLADHAKTIRYEENTEEKTDTYNIDIETDRSTDLRELAFRTFVDENCIILKMFVEAIGLEDVFLKLTTEDDEDYREEQEEEALEQRENAFAPDALEEDDASEGPSDSDIAPDSDADKGGSGNDHDDDDYKPMFS